jgi:hypothetical protein
VTLGELRQTRAVWTALGLLQGVQLLLAEKQIWDQKCLLEAHQLGGLGWGAGQRKQDKRFRPRQDSQESYSRMS